MHRIGKQTATLSNGKQTVLWDAEMRRDMRGGTEARERVGEERNNMNKRWQELKKNRKNETENERFKSNNNFDIKFK